MHTRFLPENMKGRDHVEDERIIAEYILGTGGGKMWTGCIVLGKGTSGGHL
jgi:hypothetical protein